MKKVLVLLLQNKSFEQWHEILGDHILAGAILDRIVHHSMIFKITGPSFRAKDLENINSGMERSICATNGVEQRNEVPLKKKVKHLG